MASDKLDLTTLKQLSKYQLMQKIIELQTHRDDEAIGQALMMDLIKRYVDLADQLNDKVIEVHRLSITDPLTGIYNRLHFNKVYSTEQQRSLRTQNSHALILFDIDHFKSVNDTYGHVTGDQVLIKIASIVQETIRNIDILARWGGEEFIVMALNVDLDSAVQLAERIREEIDDYKFDRVSHITCSFGVSMINWDESITSATESVDKALYEAKESGRNKVCIAKE